MITTAVDVDPKIGDGTSSSPNDGIPHADSMTSGSTAAAIVFGSLDAIIAGASFVRVLKTPSGRARASPSRSARSRWAPPSSARAPRSPPPCWHRLHLRQHRRVQPKVPGVTVYGHAGVLIGTPGFGGFYAAAGLVLGSIFPIMLGMDAEILGMRTAGVTGNDISLTAWRDAELTAGRHTKMASGTNTFIKAGTKLQLAVDAVQLPGHEKDNRITLQENDLTIVVGDYAVTISASGVMIGSQRRGEGERGPPALPARRQAGLRLRPGRLGEALLAPHQGERGDAPGRDLGRGRRAAEPRGRQGPALGEVVEDHGRRGGPTRSSSTPTT